MNHLSGLRKRRLRGSKQPAQAHTAVLREPHAAGGEASWDAVPLSEACQVCWLECGPPPRKTHPRVSPHLQTCLYVGKESSQME